MQHTQELIFDFGANAGQNLDYYLSRADKVIAIEANPELCLLMKRKFEKEIASGQLLIENYCITDSNTSSEKVSFFVHNTNSLFSQFDIPILTEDYHQIEVPAISAAQLIMKHQTEDSNILYIKIDLEGFDSKILKNLFNNNIFPKYISAESHDIEVFAALVNCGRYSSFSLIDGKSVPKFHWANGVGVKKSFITHSAGPFGQDIKENWYDKNCFFKVLFYHQLGWKDIHASSESNPSLSELNLSWVIHTKLKILMLRVYRSIFPFNVRKRISHSIYILTKNI